MPVDRLPPPGPLDDQDGIYFVGDQFCGLEEGNYPAIFADTLVTGWGCAGCGHLVEFSDPKVFGEVLDSATTHERTCPHIPRRA